MDNMTWTNLEAEYLGLYGNKEETIEEFGEWEEIEYEKPEREWDHSDEYEE